jgi:uncharacterized Zn finger protein (UPF0148 family)
MSEHEAFCRRCKTRVTFELANGVAICPSCGQQYKPNEIAHKVENNPPRGDDSLKTILTAILVLAGLSLVVLAILFAGCARQLKNI